MKRGLSFSVFGSAGHPGGLCSSGTSWITPAGRSVGRCARFSGRKLFHASDRLFERVIFRRDGFCWRMPDVQQLRCPSLGQLLLWERTGLHYLPGPWSMRLMRRRRLRRVVRRLQQWSCRFSVRRLSAQESAFL